MTLLDKIKWLTIKLVQFLFVFVFKIVLFLKYDTSRTKLVGSFNRKKRYIIAANHRHFLDPFVAISSLPLSEIKSVLPIKFITANIYYYRYYKPIAWMLGCFPAHQHKNSTKFGVNESVRLIRNGYNLFIFPEGRRVKDEPVAAKRGISIILDQLPSAELVLVNIKWNFDCYPKSLNVKFQHVGGDMHKLGSDMIMQRIYEL